MGNFKIPNVVERGGAYYYQAKREMRERGIFSEPLGKDEVRAHARAKELNDAWRDARNGLDVPVRAKSPPGTFARYVEELMSSTVITDKSVARQAEIDYSLAIIQPIFGPSQIRSIGPVHCRKFYDNLRATGSEHRAARVMKDLRFILNQAMRDGVTMSNPALGVRVKTPKARTQQWAPGQVDLAIDTAWQHGHRALAVAISVGYDTGLSPVDVRTLTLNQIEDRYIRRDRTKTGFGAYAELSDRSLSLIAAYQDDLGIAHMPDSLLIRTRRGRPYSKDVLAKDFRTVREMAGLPDGLQLRDLRRTAATETLEGGATEKEMAAAFGWSGRTASRMVDTYGPNNIVMAKGAHAKRNRNRSG